MSASEQSKQWWEESGRAAVTAILQGDHIFMDEVTIAQSSFASGWDACRASMEKEMRELMPCAHPRACWIPNPNDSGTDDLVGQNGFCIICRGIEYLREKHRAEIAEMRQLGPCGRHPKLFWVDPPEAKSMSESRRFALQGGRCTVCREIAEREAAARDDAVIDFVKEFGISIHQVCPDELKLHDAEMYGKWLRDSAADLKIGACGSALIQESLAARDAEKDKLIADLIALLNTPEIEDFDKAVPLEAAHQVQRWSASHDAGKNPEDWFWLVGYLAGKALASFKAGNFEKAKHHCISAAAALRNWHAHIRSGHREMRPGISDEAAAERTDGR